MMNSKIYELIMWSPTILFIILYIVMQIFYREGGNIWRLLEIGTGVVFIFGWVGYWGYKAEKEREKGN